MGVIVGMCRWLLFAQDVSQRVVQNSCHSDTGMLSFYECTGRQGNTNCLILDISQDKPLSIKNSLEDGEAGRVCGVFLVN